MSDLDATEAVTPPLGFMPPIESGLVYLVELDHLDDLDASHAARVRLEAEQRLQRLLGTSDRLTPRVDGFALTIVGLLREEAEALSQRLLFAIGTQPFDLGDEQYRRRTASCGWAPYPWQPTDPTGPDRAAIEHLAERALFLAQRSGSNQAVGILPMDEDRDGSSVRLVRVPGPDLLDDATTPMRVG